MNEPKTYRYQLESRLELLPRGGSLLADYSRLLVELEEPEYVIEWVENICFAFDAEYTILENKWFIKIRKL